MRKLLSRIMIPVVAASVFLGATIFAMAYSEGSPFLSKHHNIIFAYLGTFMSVTCLGYSLRKHNVVNYKRLGAWFKGHIILGAAGLFLVLSHGRFEFQALVPGLSSAAMVLVGITGLFGWYMYLTKVSNLLTQIRSLEEAEEYFLAKMASSAFRFWRFIHIVATFVAFFFTIVHGISLVVFRGEF